MPGPDKQAQLCRSLRQRIQGGETEGRDIEQRLENLVDQIQRTASQTMRDRYEARTLRLEEQRKDVERQAAEDERELKKAE